MIKRVLVVSMVGLSLVGCVNNDTLSGDVYTASEAKQVQNVSYGTIVNVRQVQIQGGDDSNVIGAIGGAVLGGFLGNTIGGGTGRFSGYCSRGCCRWCSRSGRTECNEQNAGCRAGNS